MGADSEAVGFVTAGHSYARLLGCNIEQEVVCCIEAQNDLACDGRERGGHRLKSSDPWAIEQHRL
ncbi:MAG TPA: hypothetical protein VNS79_11510 [Sphingobium sp.]|nr:hypothetical protein [Sphingobium sp.]